MFDFPQRMEKMKMKKCKKKKMKVVKNIVHSNARRCTQ